IRGRGAKAFHLSGEEVRGKETAPPMSRRRKSPVPVCWCGARRAFARTRTGRAKSSSRRPTPPPCGRHPTGTSRECGIASSAPMGSEPWGPAIYRGRAGQAPKATRGAPKFKDGSDLSVSPVWHIEPGPANAPDTISAGVEPAALFRSDDRGETWQDIDSLNYHPTRKDWQPGGGGLCLYSVLVDPRNPRHLVIGISAVGAFETRDAGRTWTTENRGVRAE